MGGFFPFSISRLLVLVSFLVCVASATDCEGDIIVSSQQDANIKLAGCDTVTGSIVIASNYSGPLIISNVTVVTGSILINPLYDPTANLFGGQNLTSLQADSVVIMDGGDVTLVELPLLSYVSMSSLQNVTAINVAFVSNGTLNFPALINATDIHVFGAISSMDFTNLTTVSEQLFVSGITKHPSTDLSSIYNGYSYTWGDYEPYQGVDVVFPGLRSAMSIGLWGNISSIFMPNLQTAALPSTADPVNYPFGTGIVVQTFGNALDVNLPAFSNADGIKLEGTLGSIELPSLYNISEAYYVNTTMNMNITTYPLQAAGNLTLLGHLQTINISSIQFIASTEILASTYGIECTSPAIAPSWVANKTLTIDEYYAYRSSNGPWAYICYPGPKFHKKKLYPVSTGGIVGIAVGIGVPLLLFIVWFVHRRGNKKIAREVEKRRQARINSGLNGADGHELQDRCHREPPPVYKEEGESLGTGRADSGVGVGQTPPGYHDAHTFPKDEE
ncbi:hypothetical protein L207DRAFT_642040 [Hyaloscypha variabilis F]|uniref:GPI-anchored cell wall organization protein Ecm33 n=1 Tax=Hyaloscypha variabilis (strain UAMH 11265 / GT02V1 / F) TaxID=1149755 RepID=A0A2J6QUJ8_HYAVF|nr:hypothetical protein L207DRAFT_642040 [Hyaloscypha variabilis F]